ncbi:Protein of unknown function [Paenibacillus sp. UNCCL117]|uniref:DUF2515 family protein n=1 Tax=unclassified Paenibacillus TaxID=185978 RepID=UPI000880BFC2|nr:MULTISPECIES: DUF2515 family protein [unclassified Paenibacillus]SDE03371.1 Protein of unknown function [Paenibacillus sp. cl123]SFW57399.1 Protein of unknown function [Paenibacillus sp. UNCCL117]
MNRYSARKSAIRAGLDRLAPLARTVRMTARHLLQMLAAAANGRRRPDAEAPGIIRVNPAAVRALTERCRWKLSLPGSGKPGGSLTVPEQRLLARIRAERDACGRNNLTRTAAYLRVYRDRPELHWALLAHMVSRNGGWTMTDLRGEFLPHLLAEQQRAWVFGFLERANALIFRDAYPQLLLYEASLQARRPLFHLLPELGVSAVMRPLWEMFWEQPDPALLTIGLIVNEQHYIEERVVRNPAYRKHVVDTLFFQMQSLLQLNQVVFPYDRDGECRLAGLTLESFSSLHERIEVGKQLYAILFCIPEVKEGVRRFAFAKRHTASRADYWPHLFSPVRSGVPPRRNQLRERLEGHRLMPGAGKLYSPSLQEAWPDRPVAAPERGDWFRELAALDYWRDIRTPDSCDMTQAFGSGLKKLELAVLAGELFV